MNANDAKQEAFRQATLKVGEAFLANGYHVTADEANTWMAQLEQGDDLEPPDCHI